MMYKNNFVAVIKCNGKILREREGGSVYLPFGAEYSILIKNKDARKASVNIEVDGEDVLNGNSLIVGGNETSEIKGFMRNMSKTNIFRFIKKTREIQNHRGDRIDDGLVRVTYRFEKRVPESITITWPERKEWIDRPDNSGNWKSSNYYFSADTTNNVRGNSALYSSCTSNCVKSFAPMADEGITVKGQKIDQGYVYGDIGILESTTHTIVLHLKGRTKSKKVAKPITVKTKFRCETCGRKNKSTNKFCFNCGTYLD